MELTQSISQQQTQKLILSTAMKQSLQVLQMPQQELYDLVSQALKSNPMLEVDDSTPPGEWEKALSVEEAFFADSDVYRTWSSDDEDFSPLATAHQEQDFCAMLREQLAGYRLPPRTAALCDYLVDCLNRRGYLECTPEDIARLLGVPLFDVMQAIYFLQSLSPPGVGARTLEECLTLQLVQSRDFNAHTVAIIHKGLGLLADNKVAAIAQLLKTDLATAQAACDAIRRLSPVPSRGYFTGEKNRYIIPDAIVKWEEERYYIQMNSSFVPRLEINRTYRELLDTQTNEETVSYIKENMAQATTLIKSIDDRGRTLYRILECIITLQPNFFRKGRGLLPMTMKDVAERLELDVSTVSRAVQEKYIVLGKKTVSLRSLFTSGYSTAEDKDFSSVTVKEKIREFIAAEDKARPLSDEDIRIALGNISIKLSRRTVAKYREELGIAPSQQRRR